MREVQLISIEAVAPQPQLKLFRPKFEIHGREGNPVTEGEKFKKTLAFEAAIESILPSRS